MLLTLKLIKMKYHILSILAVVCLITVSCKDEFLDTEYNQGLVDVAFFQTEDHALQAVTATYDVLNYEGMYALAQFFIGSSTADLVQELHGDAGRYGPGATELDAFSYTGTNRFVVDRWFSLFKGIGRANIALEKIPDIDMDVDLRNRLIAEMKFLRALYYYNVVTIYGSAPLLTSPLTAEQTTSVVKSSVDQIYAQIEIDLQDAASVLPDSYDAADLGRATSGAANALLAKVRLWTGDYPGAVLASEDVMSSTAGYELVADYASLFNGGAENSTESVFEVQQIEGAPGENVFHEEDSESGRSFLWGPGFSWSNWFNPARDFIENGYEDGDNRKAGSLIDIENGEKIDVNGDGQVDDNDVISPTPNNAKVIKYLPIGQDLANPWTGQYDVNIHVIRYAEVLLNYAEALNENNQSTEALVPLNMVRNRAGLGDETETDQDLLRQIILNERKVELAFEGHRFFDLKRTGQLTNVLGPLGFQAGKHEVFPIPTVEIDLLGIEQNPNY